MVTHRLFISVDLIYANKTITLLGRKYTTFITPAGWTFTIWTFIYAWQLLHVVYNLSLIVRKTNGGNYLYVFPGHVHWPFYFMFIINNGFITGWIFVFINEMVVVSFVFLLLGTLSLVACGIIVCLSLNRAGSVLERSGNKKDVWFTRLILLNGLAFYGTWGAVATVINLLQVLKYDAGVADDYQCAWIGLGIVTFLVITWFVLETFVLDWHLRYVFSQYITLIVAFTGVYTRPYNTPFDDDYEYFIVSILGMCCVLAAVKLLVMFIRGMRTPIQYKDMF